MNKMRYVQDKAPPPVATAADIQRTITEMRQRSWAGRSKAQIVKKGAPHEPGR